jgi:hypothetical protein
LYQILEEDCTFWEGKRASVMNTHYMVYIPRYLNGRPVTLKLLKELNDLKVDETGMNIGLDYGGLPDSILEAPISREYWCLITKDIVPDTASCDLNVAKKLLNKTGYEVPRAIEIVLCAYAMYYRYKWKI